MARVLIFGAGGFAGNYLIEEFINHGYEVFGTDVNCKKKLFKNCIHYNCNILNEEAVYDIVSLVNPDIIVNLAGISSVGASWNIPQTTIQVNVIGSLNVMEAVRKSSKNPRLLLVGSSEEYVISDFPMNEDRTLNASNPYGISKVTQERFAKMYREQYGLNIYCVRPFNHTGVGQKDSFVLPSWCKQVAKIEESGKPGSIKVGNISVKRDFSHVKDIVRAYRMIIESDNSNIVYNIGSGNAYSLEKILNYIINLSSQKIDIEIDQSRIRLTDQPMICCDYSLIKTQLSWEPEYTIFDALQEMFEDYMKQLKSGINL